ncbi:MAG TPA: hypothetical protein VMU19_07380 [Bryobacteraceae bacterium]|nr:hypothetical protein [Bryobacteraceae bacterium]
MILISCSCLVAKPPKVYVPVVTDEHVDFVSGAISVTGASGQLNVESWDGPGVQITVTRSTYRTGTPKDLDRARVELGRYHVTADKKGASQLDIRTDAPRYGFFARLFHQTPDVQVDYRIRVPRDAKLTLQDRKGDIVVTGVSGDIDARVHEGDIVVQLPPAGAYSFDAKCGLGGIYSDFEGSDRIAHAISERFTANGSGAAKKIYLRSGVGGITIQKESAPTVTK